TIQLRFVGMVRSFMPRLRAIPRIIGHERCGASSRVEFGFRNEFCARAISPVAEKNSRKRSFALRNDQIRSDRPALRTRVSDVAKTPSVKLFDYRSEEHTSELQSRFDLVCRL